MSTTITSECINCGACEPECPNTAIYGGGVEWELNGQISPAIAQDIYYIVPSKCTECVGFHDHEACAAVCPVDCCVPDPNNPETQAVLLARARTLHPDLTIADDAPSRLLKEGGTQPESGTPPAPPAAAAEANGAAPTAAAAPKPAPAPAASPKAAPAAPASSAIAAPIAMVNLPKDVGALPGPIEEKHFEGELNEDFETVLATVDTAPVKGAPGPVRVALRLLEPILGAMPDSTKAMLEEAVGSPSGFSRARSTALNIILNLILYPAILTAAASVLLGDSVFSMATRGWIFLGVIVAIVETVWRLREGILHAKPASEMIYRAAIYGLAIAPLGAVLTRGGAKGRKVERKVAFDGFQTNLHDEKLERDRRYGTVY